MRDNIEKFKNEVRTVCAKTPILLFGTKTDLRADDRDAITHDELEQAWREFKLQGMREVSSKNFQDRNISTAFNRAFLTAFYNRNPVE